MKIRVGGGLLMALLVTSGAVAQEGPGGRPAQTLNGALQDSNGDPIELGTFRGKPVIFFYEDRYSTDLNKQVKDELFARGRELGVLDRARIVAVANLSPYNWFPARNFALAAVRDAEKKFGVQVLVDFTASLGEVPWSLPTKTSSILVFDAEGNRLWKKSGRLSDEERAELFGLLGSLLGVDPTSMSGAGSAGPPEER
jgi:hypothetical protein